MKNTLLSLTIFVFPFVAAFIFPTQFWSTNAFVFLTFKQQVFISACLLICLFFYITPLKKQISYPFSLSKNTKIVLSIVSFICFWVFAQKVCYYGDAYKFNTHLYKIPPFVPQEAITKFFSWSISAWSGEGTILAIVTYIAYFFQITYKAAFCLFDAFWGASFIFIWLSFVQKFIAHKYWQIPFFILGFSAPCLLLFMGHIEIYAPILSINLLWLYVSLEYHKKQKPYLLFLSVLLWLIAIKLHTLSVLCFFSLALLIWKKATDKTPTWKQITIYILSPIYLMGLVLYFFYFKDYNDDRSFEKTVMAYDHLFLPILSPKAPLDNYNLFSIHHFFDFVSITFLWSPVALFLLLFVVLTYRKEINWEAIEIKITGLCLLLYISLFFMINPLLSLPMDWDLFSTPAPFFFVFVLVLISQIQNKTVNIKLSSASGIIACLSIPFLMIHQSGAQISSKLENLAVYNYGTYYEWTAQIFENALKANPALTLDEQIAKRDVFLNKLKSKENFKPNHELTTLLNNQAKNYLDTKTESKKALAYLKESYLNKPSKSTQLLAIEAYFKTEDYKNAFLVAKELAAKKYPTEEKALVVVVHTALEAGFHKEALVYSTQYLRKYKSPLIQKAHNRLLQNKELKTIKFLFKNPKRTSKPL